MALRLSSTLLKSNGQALQQVINVVKAATDSGSL